MNNIRTCFCGRSYRVYNMTVADQSRCPDCIKELNRRCDEPTQQEIEEANRLRDLIMKRRAFAEKL